ncbi:3-deoxy-manno-octulosonate cytidylyltransferase [Oceaniglobus ichthyenteri]|uniref:3-deoxy-manno-octulosonate cytidylyltransferase n=1 Tax=Oceaniglobus ichthyenteri TaxID=2136177 RepID=UPI000D3662F4|nr:manno-octulosonate cytidylyltransferase [Oceaniglobus ichthyenteri]
MNTVVMIPARHASTRFVGKPLAPLRVPGGGHKSLIHLTWEAAMQVRGVDAVHVVTDDTRIADAAAEFGASVLMTSHDCENGTARCAEAVARHGIDADLIVNVQGDAPLTPPWFVEDLIAAMRDDAAAQVATPVVQCDPLTYGHFMADRQAGRVGGTTAVFDARQHALYFSKEVLPYIDPKKTFVRDVPVYHHVGVYAYRPSALAAYTRWPTGRLERLEGLEQLRFLENGHAVRCVIVDAKGRVFWEVNNPEDVARVEQVLQELACPVG